MIIKTTRDIIIVSDIDGTLMDHEYDLSPAIGTIKWLQQLGIPIVLCTSKTAAEVKVIRDFININDPYIVENGGAIYGSNPKTNEEWELILGRCYRDLRDVLDRLSNDIKFQLTALNDLGYKDIKKLTGLNDSQVTLALDRHWSVPFLNPPEEYQLILNNYLDLYDINIYQGNRMSHLLGRNSHKGKAVSALKKFLNKSGSSIIALGDSPNDLPLLEIADQAIVVPGVNGPNQSLINDLMRNNINYILAPAPHAKGWSFSIRKLLEEYYL